MPTAEPTRRVFFALWPTEEQRRALAESAQSVSQAEGWRLVPALNLHVTLVFVGSVPEARMQDLSKIADDVSSTARKSRELNSDQLQIAFDAVEYWRKPRIICAIVSKPSAAASALSEALKLSLLAAGFTPDVKPFRAHVTLARKVPHGSHDRALQSVHWRFSDFALVESRTESQGAVYRVRESFPLA